MNSIWNLCYSDRLCWTCNCHWFTSNYYTWLSDCPISIYSYLSIISDYPVYLG